MLSVEEVGVAFGPTVAVDRVSLAVPAGSVTAVLGPSGCGKSTLLRAVAGLEPLRSGVVRFDGADLAGVPTHRRGFAMMFQDGQLFAHLDVARNVGYALARKGIRAPRARAEVDRLLGLVGLQGYAARRPGTLSGGEAQRVALARALAGRPRLLLLDEPLSALDRSLRERLAVDLRRVLVETATTALLVTHDHDEAFTVADRTAVMRAGRLVQEGLTPQVWAHPADADTARFLGFDTVLSGSAAELVGASSSAGLQLALRRGALRIDPAGPLSGIVRSAQRAREGVNVLVELDGLPAGPALPAVARPTLSVVQGQRVRVSVDADHLVRVGSD